MTFDGSSASAPTTAVLHGAIPQAIRGFLAIYRGRPRRTTGTRLFGRSPLDESCVGQYWEAVGELEVVARLDRLGAGWSVVHGIPGPASAGESDPSAIDHVVIGPAGVFSVTTYNHTGQNVWVSKRAFIVDGHRLQHIRRAEAAVGYVERMLEAAVGRHVMATTIIVVIDAGSLQVRDLPRDVFVVAAGSLDTWLLAREHELDPELAGELSAAAQLDTTWSRVAPDPAEAAAITRERTEFDLVRRQVAFARSVRIAWAVGAVVLLVGTLAVVSILQLAIATPA